LLSACFMSVCLVCSSTLKVEAAYSPKQSVNFQLTTLHYIPEDVSLQLSACLLLMLDSAPWSGFLKHSTVGSVEAIDIVQAVNAGHVTFAAIARYATNWLQVPLRTIHH
jgi:hypothetical protein